MPDLTDKQCFALESLLAGERITVTADTVGVSRQTIYEWMRDPVFRHAWDVGRAERQAVFAQRWQVLAEQVVRTVEAALDDPSPVIRLRAAALWLQQAVPPAELPRDDVDPVLAWVHHVRAELRRDVVRELTLAGQPLNAIEALQALGGDYVEEEVQRRLPQRLQAAGLLEGRAQ